MAAPAVLVTGGAGYIGSHACKALAAHGFTPVTVDNLVYGHRQAVQWGPLHVGDVGDPQFLAPVLERHRTVAVLHFAAWTYVGESVADPGKYYANNVAGTVRLLETLRARGPLPVVFSSSCAVYGTPEAMPIAETAPKLPINPYGRCKLMVEQVLEDYDAAYGMRFCALRYFNAAGADPDGELGEDHEPETHAIPLAIQAALGRRERFTIFGADYPTPDGTALRDYVHVTDLAEAHVAALRRLLDGGASCALNLGTGTPHSVAAIVDCVARVGGRPVPATPGPRRAGDPPCLAADAALARQTLGWRPRFASLDEIVATAWRWHSGPGFGTA
ncbi:MAG: UDP-glucose 4-epimerase GalE [Desulfovibrionaceae bacterium]|jgi:UDP-arabinose 4-epimerase|nr:UDP-glucose 4-epimerase GalE [Desulfovibrionaceae bacterium]